MLIDLIISEILYKLMMPSLRSAFSRKAIARKAAEDIRRLIVFSNIGDQLDNLYESQKAVVEIQLGEIETDKREKLLELLKEHFSKDIIFEQITLKVLNDTNWSFIGEYLRYHETAFYARMHKLEEGARNLTLARIDEYDLDSISVSRGDSIKKIVFDFNILRQAADFQSCILVPIVVLNNLIHGLDRTRGVDSLDQMIRNSCMSNENIVLSLKQIGVMYSEASDEEMSLYAGFHSSKSTLWIYSMLYEGMKRGFEKCLMEAETHVRAAAM